jgi:hypothetical protein
MDTKLLQEIAEVFQSSNVNFLLGAGTSTPLFPLLGSIEQEINTAASDVEKELGYKKYFSKVIFPNKNILKTDPSSNPDYISTRSAYESFFKALSGLLIQRKSTLLSKQINIFTTNIDFLLEKGLENLNIEYNDGFSGKFNPIFGLDNFKKAYFQRSLHFDHLSEIPVFNIIKIHGSTTWTQESTNSKITFSKNLSHIDDELESKTGEEFLSGYKKILVINPEETKHLTSILNVYYSELLRLYSSELEKENATLFTVGFSMNDRHIREITLRAAKSNPTLRIFSCCSKNSQVLMETKMETGRNPNIKVLTPESDLEKFTINYLNENLLQKLNQEKQFENGSYA